MLPGAGRSPRRGSDEPETWGTSYREHPLPRAVSPHLSMVFKVLYTTSTCL